MSEKQENFEYITIEAFSKLGVNEKRIYIQKIVGEENLILPVEEDVNRHKTLIKNNFIIKDTQLLGEFTGISIDEGAVYFTLENDDDDEIRCVNYFFLDNESPIISYIKLKKSPFMSKRNYLYSFYLLWDIEQKKLCAVFKEHLNPSWQIAEMKREIKKNNEQLEEIDKKYKQKDNELRATNEKLSTIEAEIKSKAVEKQEIENKINKTKNELVEETNNLESIKKERVSAEAEILKLENEKAQYIKYSEILAKYNIKVDGFSNTKVCSITTDNKEFDNVNKLSENCPNWGDDILQSDVLEIIGLKEEQEELYAQSKECLALCDYVQWYMSERLSLRYDWDIVNKFLTVLHSEQLIVLWGEPGSGKTSLPEAVASAIGAEQRTIAVQPNWMDNQDLLGYYNPIEKKYISTPFFTALKEAEQNPDKLYLILLDEMNLARVEYYFSEILSAMTRSDKRISLSGANELSSEKTGEFIALFEKINELEETVKGEPNEIIQKLKSDISDIKEIFAQAKEIVNSSNELKIPTNVRLIGTLNMDHTTKEISPKVIDRSYLIHVKTITDSIWQKNSNIFKNWENINNKENIVSIPASYFSVSNICVEKTEKIDLIKENAVKLANVKLSNRFDKYANQMLAWNPAFKDDWFVYDKVLSVADLKFIDVKNFNENYQKNLPLSYIKYRDMQTRFEKSNGNYWSEE